VIASKHRAGLQDLDSIRGGGSSGGAGCEAVAIISRPRVASADAAVKFRSDVRSVMRGIQAVHSAWCLVGFWSDAVGVLDALCQSHALAFHQRNSGHDQTDGQRHTSDGQSSREPCLGLSIGLVVAVGFVRIGGLGVSVFIIILLVLRTICVWWLWCSSFEELAMSVA